MNKCLSLLFFANGEYQTSVTFEILDGQTSEDMKAVIRSALPESIALRVCDVLNIEVRDIISISPQRAMHRIVPCFDNAYIIVTITELQ